ncbi:MAG: LysR family transcriptional regulator [Nannocystales bacterium]
MDWASVAFEWTRVRAFLVTAEEGSFSAAARALGMAQPTVGRQVAALEEELDVMLFERVGHGLALTGTGQSLLEHARSMGEAATRLALTAAGQSLSLDGLVVISASQVTAMFTLPPIIAHLRTVHPGIEVEIVATNDTSDLARREADIAIRSFRPQQPDLLARKVKDGAARLYASPDYLEKIGNPSTAEQLSRGQFLGFDRGDAMRAMITGLGGLGLSLTPENFPIVTGNQLVQWELTKRGAGICIMVEEIGDAEPMVRRALPDFPPFPLATWLTTHRELSTSRRMRVVFDLLLEGLKG